MKATLVSIGLVTWNSATYLPDCLGALSRQTYPAVELIVVDNASSDNSVQHIFARYPSAHIIRNSVNCGYSAAHNQAIRAASGDFYLALNPDVVMQPDYIEALVATLSVDSQCGAAGGKLLLEPAVFDSAGLFLDRRRRQYLRAHGKRDDGQFDQPCEVFGVDGAAPLYRRAMLEDIQFEGQFFDECFFAYKEDVDVAWRARLRGWKAWYEPAAVALHVRAFRPGRRERGNRRTRRYSVRNRYLLLMKNETCEGWRRDWPYILGYDVQILIYLLLREPTSLWALREAQQLWPRMQRWRTYIHSRRCATTAEVESWFR